MSEHENISEAQLEPQPALQPGLMWAEGAFAFPAHKLDQFLEWAASVGASDITFQTARPPYIEVDDQLHMACIAPLDASVITMITRSLYGDMAESILRSGRDLDCSYELPKKDGVRQRFRVNICAVEVRGAFGVNVTLRALPGRPSSFADLDIEPEIMHAWQECRGLSLVTGVPGSGKSTLLAAGTRWMLENGIGRVHSYEAPIEFVFDEVENSGALMSASEIPRHFPTFASGLRSSLRRKPRAVIVGEARDRETIEAAIHAADFGIAVFSTTHTVGVAQTIRRLLAEFTGEEKAERGTALVDLLNVIVTQCLVPNPKGGRTALREWLFFDDDLRFRLFGVPMQRWVTLIAEEMEHRGCTLARMAAGAWSRGDITEIDYRRFTVGKSVGKSEDKRLEAET